MAQYRICEKQYSTVMSEKHRRCEIDGHRSEAQHTGRSMFIANEDSIFAAPTTTQTSTTTLSATRELGVSYSNHRVLLSVNTIDTAFSPTS